MARRAGQIVISLSAGTAQFVADMDKANAKIAEFGRRGGEFGKPLISEARATSAAMKALEGNFLNNTRAADKFLETVLGLGPAMQLAFPIIGGIAFGGMLVEIGKKAYELFKAMEEAPAKINAAFRQLNAGMQLTNDELSLSIARLQNDIAKLEGRHENTLKVALAEATVAADKLSESLDKDLASVHRLLETEGIPKWKQFVLGEGSTDELKKIIEELRTREAEIEEEFDAKIRKSTSSIEQENLQHQKGLALLNEKKDAQEKINQEIKKAETPKISISAKLIATGLLGPDTVSPMENDAAQLMAAKRIRQGIQKESDRIELQEAETAAQKQKTALEIAEANAQPGRIVQDRMKSIAAQIDAVKAKLEAIGKPEAAQIMAKAFGDAEKAITELNKALERHHTQLSESQKQQIRTKELTLATADAEATWATKFAAANVGIEDRIRSQNLLTAALGKGYEATRNANVETKLMQELAQHSNDPAWMQKNQADVSKLRAGFGAEFDAKYQEQQAQTIEKLRQQIELEKALAAAQIEGVEAVREATLAVKLKQIARDNDAAAAKKLMEAELELFNAQRANREASDIARINERIQATGRLAAAILGGAEAERRAALENKYAQQQRGGASPQTIQAERAADALEFQQNITSEALKTGIAYQNQIETLTLEIQALEKLRALHGDTLAIQIAMRNLENERLRALTEESLKMGGLRDGVRAFFLDMQQQAKQASEIIYEALHSALDRASSELAKLVTGQKTDFGRMFQQIGTKMVEDSIKSELQSALGAIGKLFGIPNLGKGKPDGTPGNPLWVKEVGSVMGPGGIPKIPGLPGAGGASWPNNPFIIKDNWGNPISGSSTSTTGLEKLPSGLWDRYGAGSRSSGVGVFDEMGQPFGLGLGIGQPDGSSAPKALWVRLSAAGGSGASAASSLAGDLLSKIGIDIPGLGGGPADGTKQHPFYVIQTQEGGGLGGGLAGLFGGGGGGGGLTESVDSTISFGGAMAEGGSVDPGHVYMVGEHGTEAFVPPSAGRIMSNSDLRGAGGPSFNYMIDARGTDPVLTEQRVRTAIIAAHNSAIGTAVLATNENVKRNPQQR